VRNRFNLMRLIPILVLLIPLTSCVQKGGPVKTGPVLARVNSSTLTTDEFNDLLGPENRMTLSPTDKQEALKQWADREMVYQEALRAGLDKDRETRLLIENNRKEILVSKIMQKEISDKVAIAPEEIRAYYAAHAPEYNKAIQLRTIRVQTEEVARALAESLKAGADFATLARNHYKDPSAQQGGLYDQFLTRPEVQSPALAEAAFSLPKGGFSGVIQTPDGGFYILKVEDEKPVPKPFTLEQVGDQIKSQLLYAKQRQAYDAWIASLRQKDKVETHPELLK
jgi:peptidyl-prolyl cis-trans isomerase C